jgi:outer membrane protein assembly factor BamB
VLSGRTLLTPPLRDVKSPLHRIEPAREHIIVDLLLVIITGALFLSACGSSSSVGSTSSAKPTRVKRIPTRQLVLIDAKTGQVDYGFPDVTSEEGTGSREVSDRGGGWYVAGGFTRIGKVRVRALAHLRSDGSIDRTFTPVLHRKATPDAVLLHDGVLYVSAQELGVFALDAKSGKRLWHTSKIIGIVWSLSYGDGVLYVGGTFSRIGDVARTGIAALNAANGKPTSWQVHLSNRGNPSPPAVSSVVATDGIVYLGGSSGSFTGVDGSDRTDLAAVSARTGKPTAWVPRMRDAHLGDVDAIVVTHGQVLAGSVREGFAAFDVRTGRSLPWANRLHGSVSSFAVSGDTVYLGGVPEGGFDRVGGKPANNLASVVLPEGRFTNWRPSPNRCTIVGSIAVSGRKVLVDGWFSPKPGDCSPG